MAKRLRTPEDLRTVTLLRVAHAADEWPRWFDAVALSKVRARGPEFEYYGQALQAAADGVGVAMGISPYVDDDLNAGRLIAPFAQSVSKGEHWYLIYRERLFCEVSQSATRDSASNDFTVIKEDEVDAVNLREMGETASPSQWHGKVPCAYASSVKYGRRERRSSKIRSLS